MNNDVLDAPVLQDVEHRLRHIHCRGFGKPTGNHVGGVVLLDFLQFLEAGGVDVLRLVGQERLEDAAPVQDSVAEVVEHVGHPQSNGFPICVRGVGFCAAYIQRNPVRRLVGQKSDESLQNGDNSSPGKLVVLLGPRFPEQFQPLIFFLLGHSLYLLYERGGRMHLPPR